jgi:hypothetical protein
VTISVVPFVGLAAGNSPTWRRALLAVLLAIAVAYFATTAVQEMVSPHAAAHDFGVYFRAAQALAHGRGIYAPPPPCCFNATAMTGYTYPPLFAALLVPLTWLPIDDAGRVWLAISYAALLVILVAGVRAAPQRLSGEGVAWLGLAVLTAGAVAFALFELQATPVVVALEAIFALCVVRNRCVFAGGVCLALAVAFKVSPLLIAPALILLPRPSALRGLLGLACGLAAAGLLSLLLSHQAIYYVTDVLPSFSSGVLSANNLSLPGVLLRALAAAGVRPPATIGELFLVVEVAALAATWWLCRGAGDARGRALMIAGLLAVTPIVQGVTWDHHLIGDLLALMLLAPLLRRWSPAWFLAVGGTLVAVANRHVLETWTGSNGVGPDGHAANLAAFVAVAAFNLTGMCALWAATMLTARRIRRATHATEAAAPRSDERHLGTDHAGLALVLARQPVADAGALLPSRPWSRSPIWSTRPKVERWWGCSRSQPPADPSPEC